MRLNLCGGCTWWPHKDELFQAIKMSKYFENKAYLYLLVVWRHFFDDGECSCKLWRHWIQFLFRLNSARTSKFWRWPRIQFMGWPIGTQLQLLFLSKKHVGNHLQQVSPFKLVGVHLLLKCCLVWISHLGVKIVESFQFKYGARRHGWQVSKSYFGWFASLWKVFSDQYYVVL